MFTKSLRDMFPIAKAILQGALARDECRGAHYKPEFDMPGIDATDPAEERRQAEEWCDTFDEKNRKWLKTTIATFDDAAANPTLSYEDVDTSLIPPRPRLYGLVGAEMIEEVWKERQAKHVDSANGAKISGAMPSPPVESLSHDVQSRSSHVRNLRDLAHCGECHTPSKHRSRTMRSSESTPRCLPK